jgi:hypothetical protein
MCTTFYPPGGYQRTCDLQQVLYKNGGDWYLSDSMTDSGYVSSPHHFWASYVGVLWSANNSEVQWSPSTTTSEGSCQTTTVGVSYYASISESWTACPEKFGPVGLSDTFFGAQWQGWSQNQWIGVDAVDIVHSPPNACSCSTLQVGYLVANF